MYQDPNGLALDEKSRSDVSSVILEETIVEVDVLTDIVLVSFELDEDVPDNVDTSHDGMDVIPDKKDEYSE